MQFHKHTKSEPSLKFLKKFTHTEVEVFVLNEFSVFYSQVEEEHQVASFEHYN